MRVYPSLLLATLTLLMLPLMPSPAAARGARFGSGVRFSRLPHRSQGDPTRTLLQKIEGIHKRHRRLQQLRKQRLHTVGKLHQRTEGRFTRPRRSRSKLRRIWLPSQRPALVPQAYRLLSHAHLQGRRRARFHSVARAAEQSLWQDLSQAQGGNAFHRSKSLLLAKIAEQGRGLTVAERKRLSAIARKNNVALLWSDSDMPMPNYAAKLAPARRSDLAAPTFVTRRDRPYLRQLAGLVLPNTTATLLGDRHPIAGLH